MLLVPVASSDVSAAGYDPSSGELQLQFVRGGRIYSYQNISPDTYQAFIDAPSKGQFVNQFIKGLPVQRLL